MAAHRLPFIETLNALRHGDVEFKAWLGELCWRIDQFDAEISALLPEEGRCERLLQEAEELEKRFPKLEKRPPLFGMPVGIKDIIHVEGFTTQCGSNVPPECFAGAEADCVHRLRQAGALIVGKTVTTEFAMLDPGPTRNPWHLDHTPGGSSSGSAAGVAAGFFLAALGSQTIGSTIRPASYCGIVGFKSSFGRINLDGVVPLAPSLDHLGWFAQDVAGIASLAKVFIDGWREVPARKKWVIGVPDGPYLEQTNDEMLAVFESAIEKLQGSGFEVKRVPIFDDIVEINRQNGILFTYEIAQVHKQWFAEHEKLYRPGTAKTIREGQGHSEAEYKAAQAFQSELRQRIEEAMNEHGIDVWATPAATDTAPRGIDTTGKPTMNVSWNFTGLPALSLPVGAIAGLPVGLQLVGYHGDDETVVRGARRCEQILV